MEVRYWMDLFIEHKMDLSNVKVPEAEVRIPKFLQPHVKVQM